MRSSQKVRIDPLPRRAWLGLEVGAGLVVSALDAGGPAERAGIARGDALIALDGAPLADARDLVRRTRAKKADETIAMRVARGDQTIDRTVELRPLPVESFEAGVAELGEVTVGSHRLRHRLRAIVTRPAHDARARRDAVVVLPGLDATSVEHPLDPDHPTRALVEAFTAAGMITMRVDRMGVGDSEGPSCRETGLDEELATHDAAIEALLARDDVDPSRVFLFAPSFGGMIAPLLPRAADVAGIVVFGSSARAWDDCVMGTMIRQKKLAGTPDDELGPFVARWAELVALVVREGWTPDDVFRELPHLRACRSRDAEGRALFGREISLFQALATHDLFAAWRSMRARVLVLHGEHDWVSSLEEAKEIAHAARAELVVLPHIGHDLRAHASLRDSFEREIPGKIDSSVARAIVGWIRSSG